MVILPAGSAFTLPLSCAKGTPAESRYSYSNSWPAAGGASAGMTPTCIVTETLLNVAEAPDPEETTEPLLALAPTLCARIALQQTRAMATAAVQRMENTLSMATLHASVQRSLTRRTNWALNAAARHTPTLGAVNPYLSAATLR